jgi:hypothetical protein
LLIIQDLLRQEKAKKTDKPLVPLQSVILHSHSHVHSLNLLLLSTRRIHSHFYSKLHNPHPPLTLTLHLRKHPDNLTEISPHRNQTLSNGPTTPHSNAEAEKDKFEFKTKIKSHDANPYTSIVPPPATTLHPSSQKPRHDTRLQRERAVKCSGNKTLSADTWRKIRRLA